jgi:hypothetical protein
VLREALETVEDHVLMYGEDSFGRRPDYVVRPTCSVCYEVMQLADEACLDEEGLPPEWSDWIEEIYQNTVLAGFQGTYITSCVPRTEIDNVRLMALAMLHAVADDLPELYESQVLVEAERTALLPPVNSSDDIND